MDEEDQKDQELCMDLLGPYLGRMYPQFPNAVALYNREYPALVRAEHDDRAVANVLYRHVLHGFQREFIEESGFHFLEIRGLHLLNIRDQALLRFKKVDENGRHRNNRTEQQRVFDRQGEIPGLPPAAIRLVMGYQPDAAFSDVERVTVRRARGKWVSQIVEVESAHSWVDITPATLPFRKAGERRASGA